MNSQAVPRHAACLYARLATHWWAVVLFALAVTLLAWQFAMAYTLDFSLSALVGPQPFILEHPRLNPDSALFLHGGWYMTQGGTLYVDIWDVKPPLTYFLTATLAVLANGNMPVLFLLSGLVAAVCILGTVVLTGALVHELTGDGVAALMAGVTLFVLPPIYNYPLHGFRSKYAVLLFGVLALLCMLRKYPALAGASAAIAAGFWQFGAIFVILVLGMAARRQWDAEIDTHSVRRVASGIVLVTVLTVLPFVVWQALGPLVVETVIAPFTSQNTPLLAHIYGVVEELGYAVVLLPLSVLGWIYLALGRGENTMLLDAQWWLVAGGILYSIQVLLFDMDDWPDILVLLLFFALGVGVVVATQPPSSVRRWAIVGVVILSAVVAPIWAGSASVPLKNEFGAIQQEYPVSHSDGPDVTREENVPSVQTLYWKKIKPETCFYRNAPAETLWVAQTPAEFGDGHCGQWPF